MLESSDDFYSSFYRRMESSDDMEEELVVQYMPGNPADSVVDIQFPPEMQESYDPTEDESVPEFWFSDFGCDVTDCIKRERSGFGRLSETNMHSGWEIDLWGDFKAGVLDGSNCTVRYCYRDHLSDDFFSAAEPEHISLFKGTIKDGRIDKGTLWFAPNISRDKHLTHRFDFQTVSVSFGKKSSRFVKQVFKGRRIFTNGLVISGLFFIETYDQSEGVISKLSRWINCRIPSVMELLTGEISVFDSRRCNENIATLKSKLPFFVQMTKEDSDSDKLKGRMIVLSDDQPMSYIFNSIKLNKGWLYVGGFSLSYLTELKCVGDGRIVDTLSGEMIWKGCLPFFGSQSMKLSDLSLIKSQNVMNLKSIKMLKQRFHPTLDMDILTAMQVAAKIDPTCETETDGLKRAMKLEKLFKEDRPAWKPKDTKLDASCVIDSGGNVTFIRYFVNKFGSKNDSIILSGPSYSREQQLIHVCAQLGSEQLWDYFNEELNRVTSEISSNSRNKGPFAGRYPTEVLSDLKKMFTRVDENLNVPLHYACQYGHINSLTRLLEGMNAVELYKSCVARNRRRLTPLELCALNQHWHLLEILLNRITLKKDDRNILLNLVCIAAKFGQWKLCADYSNQLAIVHHFEDGSSIFSHRFGMLGGHSLVEFAKKTIESTTLSKKDTRAKRIYFLSK